MDTSFDTNISLDSLETAHGHQNRSDQSKRSTDRGRNVQRILVPFYEKDVLMEVSKLKPNRKKPEAKRSYINMEPQKTDQDPCNYLMNKDKTGKARRASYLEMFRKQFGKSEPSPQHNREIRSLSPQFGDTEIESIGECLASPTRDFYNTESYNEMFYEKLISQKREKLQDASFDDAELKEFGDGADISLEMNNLKSVSEVTQSRRSRLPRQVPLMNNIKLGGLGPDMEKIKPRLERARSLQRYSEKVRMENRLKIYKQSVQADAKILNERLSSAKKNQEGGIGKGNQAENNASYLVNKAPKENKTKTIKNMFKQKPKNAGSAPLSTNNSSNHSEPCQDSAAKVKKNCNNNLPRTEGRETNNKERINSTTTNKRVNATAPDPEPPLQINFLLNVGSGLRPSTILRKLEEKHRLYQAKVKPFIAADNHFVHHINLN